MTGVSRGTVDRVLHNRGSVAPAKKKAVMEAIEKAGFKPNEFASLIATNRSHRIVCLIPRYFSGDVWELTAAGMAKAADEVKSSGVEVEIVTYDQYDSASFSQVCEALLADAPSGVVVAPMFRMGTMTLVRELASRGIPYVYIDTKLDDDSYLEFFGLPMYQSGYLGGEVLTQRNRREISEILNVRIRRDKNHLSDPTMLRRAGFLDFVNEYLPWCEVRDITINPQDLEETYAILDKEFLPDLEKQRNLVMFNSRVYIIANYIRERGVKGCNILGYDMLERNLQSLKDGTVDWIIAQHSDIQAGNAVRTLANYLALNRPIAKRDNYSQMDILNRFNCDYYV